MSARRLGIALGLWLAALGGGTASAQVATAAGEPSGGMGITVFGTGEARAKPNVVEVDLRVSGAAELSGDAIVKYRDAKKRTLAVIEALKMKNLEIEETGLSVGGSSSAEQVQMMMRGMAAQGAKPQTEIARTLRVTLRAIQEVPEDQLMETIGKLLDGAKDSGATVGPSPEEVNMAWRYGRPVSGTMTRFVLTNFAELREQAYEQAVTDARLRAERLAKLNGVKLGRVISVQEVQVSGDQTLLTSAARVTASGEPWESTGLRVTSDKFAPIPVGVKLLVRFAIAAESTETAGR